MKKVVVTGATGFIGSWLVREMLRNRVAVVALVRDTETDKFDDLENKDLLRLVQYHSGEYHELEKENDIIDAFYHLAWAGVSTEQKNDGQLQLNNIHFSMEMLEYAARIRAGRFLEWEP